MMKSLSRKFLLHLLLAGCSLNLSAQDVTGIWKGYFITESGENYRLEFQVLQKGASGATGVSYSYLDVRFYGKATMTGNFIKTSSSFRIREIKTVEVKSTMGGGTCIMNYDLAIPGQARKNSWKGPISVSLKIDTAPLQPANGAIVAEVRSTCVRSTPPISM